jgi:xylulokinase
MGLLGLDIGTSGCKATIIDFEGNVKGQAYKEYSLFSPNPGLQELNPLKVWDSVKEVIAKSISGYRGDNISALSVSSFGEAVIPIDNKREALHNSLIYIDERGIEEAGEIEKSIGTKKVHGITGTSIHSMYSICKIMWFKKHMPEVYNNTWKFLLFADFILLKLGAKPHTDYSLAARTMAFDVVNKRWSPEILDAVNVGEEKFGEPVQSGTVIGEILPHIAEELGLPKRVLLVSGGHDQPCAALGAGVIKGNIAVDGLGTTECVTPAFDKPVISEKMAESSFACVPHVKKDMYVTYAFTFTSGSLLRWYRDNFGFEYREEAVRKGANIYDILIEKASKNPSGIFVLPHFSGAATPYMDTQAKGAVIGLGINTTNADIIKGILEGITYEMMVNLERLSDAGINTNELRAVGGLAKSEQFLQLKADMMGKKVISLKVAEAGTLGVAMLAGTASGAYKSLEDAVEKLIKVKNEYHPDQELHQRYLEKFQTYKKIYPAVKSIFASSCSEKLLC